MDGWEEGKPTWLMKPTHGEVLPGVSNGDRSKISVREEDLGYTER